MSAAGKIARHDVPTKTDDARLRKIIYRMLYDDKLDDAEQCLLGITSPKIRKEINYILGMLRLDYCTDEMWNKVIKLIECAESVTMKKIILLGNMMHYIGFLANCMAQNMAEAEDNVPLAVSLFEGLKVWVKDFVALAKNLNADNPGVKFLEDSLEYHLTLLEKAKTKK
jgi:hypothetical protein